MVVEEKKCLKTAACRCNNAGALRRANAGGMPMRTPTRRSGSTGRIGSLPLSDPTFRLPMTALSSRGSFAENKGGRDGRDGGHGQNGNKDPRYNGSHGKDANKDGRVGSHGKDNLQKQPSQSSRNQMPKMPESTSQSDHHKKCLQPADLGATPPPFNIAESKKQKGAKNLLPTTTSRGTLSSCRPNMESSASGKSEVCTSAAKGGSKQYRKSLPKRGKLSLCSCDRDGSKKAPASASISSSDRDGSKTSNISACSRCGRPRDDTNNDQLRLRCRRVPKTDPKLNQLADNAFRCAGSGKGGSFYNSKEGRESFESMKAAGTILKYPCLDKRFLEGSARLAGQKKDAKKKVPEGYNSQNRRSNAKRQSESSTSSQQSVSNRRQTIDKSCSCECNPPDGGYSDCELSDAGSEAFFDHLKDNVESAVKKSTEEVFGCYFRGVNERLDDLEAQIKKTDGRICKIYTGLAEKLSKYAGIATEGTKLLSRQLQSNNKFVQDLITKLGKAMGLQEFGGSGGMAGMGGSCRESMSPCGLACATTAANTALSSPPAQSSNNASNSAYSIRKISSFHNPSPLTNDSTYADEISKVVTTLSSMSMAQRQSQVNKGSYRDPVTDPCGQRNREEFADDDETVLLCVIDKRSRTETRR